MVKGIRGIHSWSENKQPRERERERGEREGGRVVRGIRDIH